MGIRETVSETGTETRFVFLLLWMQKVAECEGGEVVVFEDKGVKKAFIRSVIPVHLWCERCLSLIERIADIQERWESSTPSTLVN